MRLAQQFEYTRKAAKQAPARSARPSVNIFVLEIVVFYSNPFFLNWKYLCLIDFYRCSKIQFDIIFIHGHKRLCPAVNPFRRLWGQVNAAVALRRPIVIMPVSAVERDTRPRNITYPGYSWKIKFTASQVRSHVTGRLFSLHSEFSNGCIPIKITAGYPGGENRSAAFKSNHSLAS